MRMEASVSTQWRLYRTFCDALETVGVAADFGSEATIFTSGSEPVRTLSVMDEPEA